jgi:hypothetical protein
MNPDPRREEVVAWMRAQGVGYKATGKHFGIAPSTIRDWVKQSEAAPAARSRAHTRARSRSVPAMPGTASADGGAVSLDAPKGGRLILTAHEDAVEAVGPLKPGGWVAGITKGQLSMWDLVLALMAQHPDSTGELDVATWTVSSDDSASVASYVDNGRLTRVGWIVDRSFPTRKQAYARTLSECFGFEAIHCTDVHAKFALLAINGRKYVIRGSMNFNRSPRFEQYDVNESPELFTLFAEFVRQVRSVHAPGFAQTTSEVREGFELIIGPTPDSVRDKASKAATEVQSVRDLAESDFYGRKLDEVEGYIVRASEAGQTALIRNFVAEQRALRAALREALALEARDRGVTAGLTDLDAKILAAERVRAALRAHQERASHPSASRERML